jgi:hypothetical protein
MAGAAALDHRQRRAAVPAMNGATVLEITAGRMSYIVAAGRLKASGGRPDQSEGRIRRGSVTGLVSLLAHNRLDIG